LLVVGIHLGSLVAKFVCLQISDRVNVDFALKVEQVNNVLDVDKSIIYTIGDFTSGTFWLELFVTLVDNSSMEDWLGFFTR